MKFKRYFSKPHKLQNISKPKKIKEQKQIVNKDPLFSEYFAYNHSLQPPYQIIIDTNFIIHSLKRKLNVFDEIFKCLSSTIVLNIPECVFGELEKLGNKYILSLKVVKNLNYHLLTCDHKGTYADDCIVNRVSVHRCYIVATCDTQLKQRIRMIPGVPIMYIKGRKYDIESLPML